MSVTCRQRPSTEASTSTAPSASTSASPLAVSPARPSSAEAPREAIVIGDPSDTGYAVVLPPVASDTQIQTAMTAIAAQTPFVAYRRSALTPTTYESVTEVLETHPAGAALRRVLNRHFEFDSND